MNKQSVMMNVSEEIRESTISTVDQLEAKCRYCGDWFSNRTIRQRHEEREHYEEQSNYRDCYRDPNNGELFNKKDIVVLES